MNNEFLKKFAGFEYKPEASDKIYTAKDFLSIARGNEKYAASLMRRVEWQHPETLVLEDLMEGEVIELEDGTFKLVYQQY